MRRLLVWVACWARDDRGHDVVHNQERYFQDQAVMLGLLGRALLGFGDPDSELQRGEKQTHMGTASESARFCGDMEFFFILKKADGAYHGRPRRLPRVPPISRDREACHIRRRLPWGVATHWLRRREIRVGCSVLG